MAEIIDGKAIAAAVKEDLAAQAKMYEEKYGRKIGLAVVKVGNDPASEVYVRNKIVACGKTGVRSFSYELPEDESEEDLLALVDKLNDDPEVDGILVQLPLPKHLNEKKVLARIRPEKDADGFHVVNAGGILLGLPCTKPCTPAGIIELIKSTGADISGKHAVVIGRSNIVGKPCAMLLLAENATVTICHSRTVDLKSITLTADILVAAGGIKEFVTGDMIKPGGIVIDDGMHRGNGTRYGDVHFPDTGKPGANLVPVPGGVGPMTIAMLLKNTVEAAYRCREN